MPGLDPGISQKLRMGMAKAPPILRYGAAQTNGRATKVSALSFAITYPNECESLRHNLSMNENENFDKPLFRDTGL